MPSSIAAVLFMLAFGVAAESRVGLVSFRRVAIPDDVPAHLCTAIAQDRSGLLWFGTQGGLVRYDGYEFRVHRSNPDDPTTLAGNYVRSLLVASDGRLWVGTFSGGLSVFDPRTEKFTRHRLAYDRVEGLAEDRSGRIWIATTAGLARLDPKSSRIVYFRHEAGNANSIADDRVRGLLVDRGGTLWVGTRDGLQRWRGEGRGFERVAPVLAGQYATRLYEDRRGRIWVGTEEHGAAVVDPRDGSARQILPRPADANGLSHYWVYGFAEGVGEEMWIATFGGGVDIVDARSLAVIDRLRNDPVLQDTIGADRIGAVFRDRSGLMWVGSWGEGLARHDPRTRALRSLRFSPNRSDGLTHAAVVRAIETREGNILVGTNGNGIDVLDATLHRVANYALPDDALTCLAQSADGTIWAATLNSSLHRLLPNAKQFERVPSERLAGGPIRSMAFGRDGTLWTGASEGMVRIDPRTLATRVYRQWPGAAQSSPAIESIVVTTNGMLWVGTDNGLYSFDPRTEVAVRIAKDASRADGLPDNWVPDLMLARDGRLWVGTAGGAAVMTRWDGRNARFDSVARKLGRATTPAEALIEDDAGMVWIGPRLRVDPRTWTARELGPSDGIAFRNFYIASRARTRDGRLLFGSPEGLLVIDPRALRFENANAPIVATALRVEGKPRPGAVILSEIGLSKSERSFTLDFAALDFAESQRLVYRHRLEGLDDAWTTTGVAQHSVTYSRLPPGEYTLRVGVLNDAQELRLPVTVLPAVHQTPWFRALMAIVAAALLYGAYRLRVRQLRARERALEGLVQRRTEQLEQASLTDPLTGLRNRRYLEQTIDADLEIAARGGVERDLVILMIDLDHFKSVNDQYGHAAGDAVLVKLAQLLLRTFRASDAVVRWGGEEFLIVVRFVDRACAAELAEKLRSAVEDHPFVLPDGTTIQRTCSIGFAAWPLQGLSWERAVDLADAALYRAKNGGRNAWAG
ncbi:MAG TPA: two-component regulator propeller domain-containing protein [Thermoanaerobaculia bacterium]|jgi:diguanylate cyclase (GGDEF)-like protein|nr:two-component regulator propeller domain-containing protein [Thermoanaerobaculia bacterium]